MAKKFIPPFDLKFLEDDRQWILNRFENILSSGFVSASKNVREFEEKVAEFCGVKYAVAVSNGTAALEVILRAIEVSGGTVIVPSMTFMATPLAAVHAGARVIFADCQSDNLQMDPDDLERKLRDDTKAVILVHLSGVISPHIERIRTLCSEKEIPLIEDAAHAHGAEIDGRLAGSLGTAAAFSFFSTKVLTMGEGGAAVTNDEELYKRYLVLRDQGRPGPEPNLHTELGNNWRASEFNAVVGIRQLEKAVQIIGARRRLAQIYDQRLREKNIPGIKLLEIPHNIKSGYYKYVLFAEKPVERDVLKPHLREKYGVCLSGEVYNRSCHDQPVWDKYPETIVKTPDYKFPHTDYVVGHHFCLPLHSTLTLDDAEYIVESLESAVDDLYS